LRSTDTTEATIHSYLEEIAVLPLTDAMAVASSSMPVDMLPDPMDRIVAATARSQGIRYGRSASAELHVTQNDLVVPFGWRHS
jgi:PIN domain nuclease of toxin-antitoxin system